MAEMFDRTKLLIGEENLEKLKQAHVAVAGIGGVGSYVAEGLARAGVGNLTLIDNDCIDVTNLNRQIHALHSTIGMKKTDAMAKRILDINPLIRLVLVDERIIEDNVAKIFLDRYDYMVDAVDDVRAKIAMVKWAKEHEINIICSMGTANKLSAQKFEICDISKTEVCPLARTMRRELRKIGIEKGVEVLYSKDEVIKPQRDNEDDKSVGSISYVPSVAGLLIAGNVVRSILEK